MSRAKVERLGRFLAMLFIAFMAPEHAWAAAVNADLEKGHDLLRQWRVEEAERIADNLARRGVTEPSLLLLQGMVRLHQGRYAEAFHLVQQAVQDRETPGQLKSILEMMKALAQLSADFQEARSPHFIFRYTKGKDAVLTEDALAVLEKAYANVGADLKFFPAAPVIVEVYPDADSFCTASTLEKKDVERSGAIGICHFNRIMITSPRALMRGYPWLDTLCHEYTHYIVTKKSNNSIPVWLQEGIAKYEESRWRRPSGGEMDLVAQTTLAQALEQNQLVTFEQMHPTLAKLDFRQAQTAYAEMEVMVEFIHKTGGPDALPSVLDRVARGVSVEQALSLALKMDFPTFLEGWKAYMKKRPLKKIPGLQIIRPKLAKGPQNVDNDAGFQECEHADARKFALLGDLLRGEGLWESAVIEYDKALKAAGLLSPQIMNKVAAVLIRDEQFQRAESILNTVKETYPNYVTTYANLGALQTAQKKFHEAAQSLRQALAINPFDPFVRQDLAAVYSHLKMDAEANREREKLRIVIGDLTRSEANKYGE